MKKELISIIVSVYNTEKYIAKCLDSLLSQTYSKIEIIIVNDGSLDGSQTILEQYQKKDSRIILLKNEKNMGLAYSRNLALEKCKGKYVGFIDSDDYVDSNYYEQLYQAILNDKSDIAICDIKSIYENSGAFVVTLGCNPKETGKISYIHTGLAASACNKLFKRHLFLEAPFAIGKVNEDVAVIIPLLVNAFKISYVSQVYYYYVQREDSIQNSTFSEKKFDIFDGVQATLQKIQGCEDESRIAEALIFNQIILWFLYEFPKIPKGKTRIRYFKQFYQKSKAFSLLQNSFYREFLKQIGKKTRYFYQMLLFLECHRFYHLVDFLISFYGFYKKQFQTVFLPDYSLDDLVCFAKQNQTYAQQVSISVVVPNYNYESFLLERIGSILKQHVRIQELILLDDCSTDQSVILLDQIANCLQPYLNVQRVYNSKNSGIPFRQWAKGFQLAKGDYVWICEADDYCEEHLLEELIRPIQKRQNVVISYCDTAMMDAKGSILLSSVTREIDIQKTGHWKRNYVNSGLDEILKYAFLNGTIANVSSTLIRNGDYEEIFKECETYRQAGDWLFYLYLMQQGDVAFSKKVYNYYRIHGNNVTSVMKKQAHFQEIQSIHQYLRRHFILQEFHEVEIQKRYQYLKKVWELKD